MQLNRPTTRIFIAHQHRGNRGMTVQWHKS